MVAAAVRIAAVLLMCIGAAHARTVELPAESPFVRFELPDAWNVLLQAPDVVTTRSNGGYVFSVQLAPKITQRDQVDAELSKIVAGGTSNADFRNAAAGDPSDWENEHGVWIRGVRIDAERADDGTPMVLVFHLVEVAAGRYLVIWTAGSPDADAAEEPNYDAVFASLEAIGD